MKKIHVGPASTTVWVSNHGVAHARTSGLYLAANAGALSAKVLDAAVGCGARGLVISLEGVAFALPQMTAQHYRYVEPALRYVPVALVVNGEQAAFLSTVPSAAASAGTMRRVFLSHEDAEHWLQEQVRALAANRVWWEST
jgi:hypothetical protein